MIVKKLEFNRKRMNAGIKKREREKENTIKQSQINIEPT